MKIVIKLLSIIIVFVFCLLSGLYGYITLGEGFNPAVPDIDTRFTKQYDEKKFFSIRIGTDTADITKAIGQPFVKQRLNNSNELWYYSDDGKCKWFDFAWLGRELEIDTLGKVVSVNLPIHYD